LTIEIEKQLIGYILTSVNEQLIKVMPLISPDIFQRADHQKIIKAIQELYLHDAPIDQVSVSEKAKVDVGYLFEITDRVLSGTTTAIEHHAKQLTKRLAQKQVNQIVNVFGDFREAELEDIIEGAQDALMKITEIKLERQENLVKIEKHYDEAIDRIVNDKKSYGVPTGIPHFDYLTNGLQNGELIIIGARPSVGKTAFATNIIYHAAVEKKQNCALFSLEMDKEKIIARLAAVGSELSLAGIKKAGGLDLKALKLAPIFIDDTPQITVLDILSKCKSLKIQAGLDLIVIDYLQLITPHIKGENQNVRISAISRALKLLARELNCPVVCLSQLSRKLEETGRRPMLSDLRDSGAIEQDADVIAFLHRDNTTQFDDVVNVELIIGKNRNGMIGACDLQFVKHCMKFREVARG